MALVQRLDRRRQVHIVPFQQPGVLAETGLTVAQAEGAAWVVDGQVCVRPVVTLTLSFDHRCIDGALGSQVLTGIAQFLADPAVGLAGATAPR